ncbi:MAG: bifunctional riboflavin kinase/FAD synthetase [Tenericutes bacterium]|nr:bifunctional riboflavin kinase/FAD synthetase [Mycoplasmatota bacterium]
MLEIKHLEYTDNIQETKLVLCLGFFDGMHIAHLKLIEEAKKVAVDKQLPLAVFTFSTNIQRYLRQEEHRCLTTIEDKAKICSKLNVDYLYVMNVDDNLIHIPAQQFINQFLSDCDTVVFGYDFNFGYKGDGDRHLLKQSTYFKSIVIPEVKHLGLKIGTTRIRANLVDGNLSLANYLLGRNYSIKGKVIAGRGIGKKLGYPTANIQYTPYWLPKSGVYYTYVYYKGSRYYAVTNIGNKPTFTNLSITVETYIIDLNENLYDELVQIEFVEYIRQEIKFNEEAELSSQILKDIEYVKKRIKED